MSPNALPPNHLRYGIEIAIPRAEARKNEKRIVDFNNFISKVLRRKQLAEGKKDQPIIGSRH